jgi:hypothetical protein
MEICIPVRSTLDLADTVVKDWRGTVILMVLLVSGEG